MEIKDKINQEEKKLHKFKKKRSVSFFRSKLTNTYFFLEQNMNQYFHGNKVYKIPVIFRK